VLCETLIVDEKIIFEHDKFGQLDHIVFIFYTYPNLTFANESLSATSVRSGDSLTVSLDVANIGTVQSKPGSVSFYLNPNAPSYITGLVGDVSIPAIDVGNAVRISHEITIPPSMSVSSEYYSLSFWVDSTDATLERDELSVMSKRDSNGRRHIPESDPKDPPPLNNRGSLNVRVIK